MQRYFEICESISKISEFLRCSKMKINIQIVSIWTNFDIIYQNLSKFAREFEKCFISEKTGFFIDSSIFPISLHREIEFLIQYQIWNGH